MARARNIKPGFFINEDLVELGFATRLLFAGLWTLADREGRLEDRPKKIKIGVFPADDVNVDVMLQELHDAKFIQRYEINGVRYVQITNWSKHQNPHHTEKQSEIPDINGELTVKAPKKISNNDTEQLDINGELTVKDLEQDSGNLADSLIPDSLIHKEAIASSSGSAKRTVPNCPADELIDAYEAKLPMLPTVRRSLFKAGKNMNAMRQRWAWVMTEKYERGNRAGQPLATSVQEGLEWFERYFAYAAESDFLTGRNGKWTSCDLAWLMTAGKFESVLSGKYHEMNAEVT